MSAACLINRRAQFDCKAYEKDKGIREATVSGCIKKYIQKTTSVARTFVLGMVIECSMVIVIELYSDDLVCTLFIQCSRTQGVRYQEFMLASVNRTIEQWKERYTLPWLQTGSYRSRRGVSLFAEVSTFRIQ
jgi:hypothetical protein